MAATILFSRQRIEVRLSPTTLHVLATAVALVALVVFISAGLHPVALISAAVALLLLLVPSHRISIDRVRERVTLSHRRLFVLGRERQFPLLQLADIDIEKEPDSDGDHTYRAVLVLRDGERLPVTRSKASFHQAHAEALRAFFNGQEVVAPPPQPLFPLFVLIVASGLIVAGLTIAGVQELRLARAQPVIAQVLDAHVDREEDSDGVTYFPRIHFAYELGEQRFESHRLQALSGNGSASLVSGVAAGQRITAWYDPETPSEAFFSRERNPLPLFLIAMGLLFGAFGRRHDHWRKMQE